MCCTRHIIFARYSAITFVMCSCITNVWVAPSEIFRISDNVLNVILRSSLTLTVEVIMFSSIRELTGEPCPPSFETAAFSIYYCGSRSSKICSESIMQRNVSLICQNTFQAARCARKQYRAMYIEHGMQEQWSPAR